MGYPPMDSKVELSIVNGDIFTVPCDVAVFKFARNHHGADSRAAHQLEQLGVDPMKHSPDIGQSSLVSASQISRSKYFLFVGTNYLRTIEYIDLCKFSYLSLKALGDHERSSREPISQIAMTLHGPGFGLDEIEAALCLIEGCDCALRDGVCPPSLAKIIIVEFDQERYKRLNDGIEQSQCLSFKKTSIGPRGPSSSRSSGANDRYFYQKPDRETHGGTERREKPHVFVAMPFDVSMHDIFYYGIQAPIHKHDFLCERVDQQPFVGDVMDRVRQRIETSAFVVADLTGANANVYLEVGYAWGVRKPAVLLCSQASEKLFDVRGQNIIVYNSIQALEKKLDAAIAAIKTPR